MMPLLSASNLKAASLCVLEQFVFGINIRSCEKKMMRYLYTGNHSLFVKW